MLSIVLLNGSSWDLVNVSSVGDVHVWIIDTGGGSSLPSFDTNIVDAGAVSDTGSFGLLSSNYTNVSSVLSDMSGVDSNLGF